MSRQSKHDVLAELIASQKITSEDALRIEDAPQISIPTREIVSYLGAGIVLVGVVRLVAFALQDASRISISIVLYVCALGTGYCAYVGEQREGAWLRFGELMELATLSASAVASGILLNEIGTSGEWSALSCAVVVAMWALARMNRTEFAAAVALPVSFLVIAGTGGSLAGLTNDTAVLPFLGVGVLSVLIGTRHISSPQVMRGIGGLIFLMTGPGWVASRAGYEGVLPVVLIGIVFFALGAQNMWLELIPTAALVIVISLVIFIVEHVSNEVLQGVLIVLIGTSVFAGSVRTFRKR